MASPVYVYDFTVCESGEDKPTITVEQMIHMCKELCKKWCFQLEDSGNNRHYQGRCSLKAKVRPNICTEKFRRYLGEDAYIHISTTSCNSKNDTFYVTKEETRIGGPWSDKDEENRIKVPRQIAMIIYAEGFKWRPFQQKILESFDVFNTCHINVLYDPTGGYGKTTVKTTAGVFKRAMTIPVINDYKDVMRMVMDMPKVGGYIIDMPKAIKKEKLYQLYSAIENIKDGYAFDDRYNFKYEYFDSPVIWVFCNTLPDRNLLTERRWKIWMIDENYDLVKYSEPQELDMGNKVAPNIIVHEE